MRRSYTLVRYIPDPIRGESINVAIVAHVDGMTKVMCLDNDDVETRLRSLAPHIDPASACHYMEELRTSDPESLERLLSVFNPHVVVEAPRRISSSVDLEQALHGIFYAMVAVPKGAT